MTPQDMRHPSAAQLVLCTKFSRACSEVRTTRHSNMSSHRFTIDTLKELIVARHEAAQGLRICSEFVRTSRLQELVQSRLEGCTRALEELQSLVRLLGGNPDVPALDVAGAHRRWADLRTALACNVDGVILDECERGESRALEVYRNAMDDPLPGLVRAIVLRQFEDVMTNYDQIRDLRSQRAPLVDPGVGSGAQAG
jgi:uncharacterized protein (TIGR02284 family)